MISRSAASVVQALGGRATTAELRALVSAHHLRAAVARGDLVRSARGRYQLPTLPDPAATAAALGGLLSHASAAQEWGMELLVAPREVHVTVTHGSYPTPREGVRVHQSRRAQSWPATYGRPTATSPLRTVLDCATTLPFAEALAVADSALGLRYVDAAQLWSAAEASKGPGRARRLTVARHADGRAANAFESALRAIVIEAGITGFVPQCPVVVRRSTWHVDVGDPVRRIAGEADSYQHHGSRRALVDDCERYDELTCEGWLVLRFAWEHVMFRRAWVATAFTRACALR